MDELRELGLDETCSAADVKDAYRKLAKIHHPDAGGNAEAFTKLQEAYKKALEFAERKKTCDRCNGKGKVINASEPARASFVQVKLNCPVCHGKGWV